MGATFSRVKNWTTEILSNTDLNAEIDNILDNLGPAGVDDYSATTTQMRITTDPGEVGTESLATSLAGELERLRFAIKEIKGSDAAQWYSSPGITLTDVLNSLGGSVGDNRIVSGAASSNSGAPRFLVAAGTTTSITLDAAPTSFSYYINGTSYAASADVTFTGLATASITNNTCLVNDADLTSQERSKWVGEYDSDLIVDNMGTDISTLVGKYAGFKVVSGGNTEYFIGYVKSTTRLSNCLRGYFFNSSNAAMPRIPIADNNTITLTKLTWMFANTSAGLAASYANPSISHSTPSDTTVYWLDLATNVWKTHNGSSWVTASVTLIGACVQDSTACKGARSFDFFGAYDPYSNIQLDYVTVGQVQARNFGSKVGVGSTLISFGNTRPIWDMATNLESGYTESASTTYFLYVGDSGQIRISPERPYFSAGNGKAWYHPYETWRAAGYIQNGSGSDFDRNTLKTYALDANSEDPFTAPYDLRNIAVKATPSANTLIITVCAADGTELSHGNPGFVNFKNAQTDGVVTTRKLTQNIVLTLNQSASLGHMGGMDQYIWTYLIANTSGGATTVDVGVLGVTPLTDHAFSTAAQINPNSTLGTTLYANSNYGLSALRLIARISSNQATAGTWVTTPSQVAMQPQILPYIEDWNGNRTCSTSNFSNPSITSWRSRRVGDMLHVRGFFQSSSGDAAAAQISLPSGLTIDSTRIPTPGPVSLVGSFYVNAAATDAYYFNTSGSWGALFCNSSVALTVVQFALSGANKGFSAANASQIVFATSVSIGVDFQVPIVGWNTYGP